MTTLSVSEKVFTVAVAGEALTVSVAADVVRALDVGVAGPQGPSGPAGPPGAAAVTYTHTQASPAATWTVTHNLGYRPAVELLTPGGAEMEGDVVHLSSNQCLVYFVIAVAGTARLQ